MRFFSFLFCVILSTTLWAQTVPGGLTAAWQRFQADSQLRSATASLYVINAKTGTVVFAQNAEVGLATASTLKIVTAATAYELLGRSFRYETEFGYTGNFSNHQMKGAWYIKPSGDPTLGSWRWAATKDSFVLNEFASAARKLNSSSSNQIIIDESKWNAEIIPDGWTWQDIGNYYGAGARGFNWHENQFDIIMRSGSKIGDPVTIVATKPASSQVRFRSLVTAAAKGTGDNSYVYYPLHQAEGIVRGTIPVNENAFTISAASPDADKEFTALLAKAMGTTSKNKTTGAGAMAKDTTILVRHLSPSLDSIVYWFLKRSINLYGEALVKTMAYQKGGEGSTDKGVDIVRKFWKDKGIDPVQLNIVDGSGLSPLNRVTTKAQVQVLQYAKQQSWFPGFYDALPVYNDMKMKSGTIRGVKGFCGYHSSRDGNEYIFSFLVNNYNGSAAKLVLKMYDVLDNLK